MIGYFASSYESRRLIQMDSNRKDLLYLVTSLVNFLELLDGLNERAKHLDVPGLHSARDDLEM